MQSNRAQREAPLWVCLALSTVRITQAQALSYPVFALTLLQVLRCMANLGEWRPRVTPCRHCFHVVMLQGAPLGLVLLHIMRMEGLPQERQQLARVRLPLVRGSG